MAVTEGPDAFRASQMRARDMLRGDLEGEELEKYVQERIITTTLDKAVSWAVAMPCSPPHSALPAVQSK
jgi:NADH-quinone oxidoreductase subunit B